MQLSTLAAAKGLQQLQQLCLLMQNQNASAVTLTAVSTHDSVQEYIALLLS
jgi:hypothetical protein